MDRLNEYQRELLCQVRRSNGREAASKIERGWSSGRNVQLPGPMTVVIPKPRRTVPVLRISASELE